jgi:SAM-dependent methyltransferase
MTMPEILFEVHQGLTREGPGLGDYTRRAFEMLPAMSAPRILDIGCGPGGPTIEVAKLSGGEVIGMDNHQPYLDDLVKSIEREGLSDRVSALECSMFEMDFPDERFDIIWSEGSIFVCGFERGLNDWKRLLVPGGCLAIHHVAWLRPDPPAEIFDYWKKKYPAIASVPDCIEIIDRCGYELIGHFPLPEDAWWIEYYGPLEDRLVKLREKYAGNQDALEYLETEQEEIDMYKKHNEWYGSVFYILRKGK